MRHFLIFLSAFCIILIIAVLSIRVFSGPEDSWICQNGQWVKHGHPYAPKPFSPCGFNRQRLPVAENSTGAVTATSADQILYEISVTKPEANELVRSPLEIEGEAIGNWFFEGSFPVKLIGEEGTILAQGAVQAQGDWMTDGFVPFKAELEFDPKDSTIGMLIFQNDNPSGLPENEKQFGLPVRFSFLEKMTVKIYFSNTDLNPEAQDCGLVFPVNRRINKTKTIARAVLEELLAGPTDMERTQGYFTSLNPGVKINSLTINNGTAKVDFNEKMEFQMGGSCRVAAIRAQITETLKQFPSVKDVIISVAGRSEDVLQP